MNHNAGDEDPNKKDSDPVPQANTDAAVYIHVVENEEEDVRRTVLREEKGGSGERSKPVDDSVVDIGSVKENVVMNVQVEAWQGQGQLQGVYWQQQPQPGQGGYYPPMPPPGQGGYYPPPPPPGQGGYYPPPRPQGGYYQPPPQGQGGYYQQPPPPVQGGFFQGAQGNQPAFNQGWSSMASGIPMLKEHRGPFIRKVFFVLFICMCAISAFAVFTFVVPGVRSFFKTPFGLMIGIFGMMLVIAMTYVMMCSECSRQSPCNCVCLTLTVVGECLFFGCVTAKYNLVIILVALVVTCVIVLICFALAFTPLDFTKCYIYLTVIGLALVVFCIVYLGVILVFNQKFPLLHLVLGLVFVLFESVCFMMELQMILGGKTVELGVNDWALGVFMLFTSIMTIFFDILCVLNVLDYI